MSRTITVIGARGGSGTSTVAAALACLAAAETTVTLAGHDPVALAHLLAVPAPLPGSPVTVAANVSLTVEAEQAEFLQPDLRVIDGGTLANADGDGNEDARYVVVRGPCYLALATLVGQAERNFDGVILLSEPGRAMTATHVADVTGLPIIASIPVHARVARCLDAGVLANRADRLPELGELKALAGLQVELHRTAVGRDIGIGISPAPDGLDHRTPSRGPTR